MDLVMQERTIGRSMAAPAALMAVVFASAGCKGARPPVAVQDNPPATHEVALSAAIPHDGARDFDFDIGTWNTRSRRLQHPLAGAKDWIETEGTTVVRKVWGGKANLAEIEMDGPAGHTEALALRLYQPEARQWTIHFASSGSGTLSVPMTGEFHDGRGEFVDQESYDDRAILVRFTISATGPSSARSEQAFSSDGGKTWETNWITEYTRIADAPEQTTPGAPASMPGENHDFDWQLGAWKTQIRGLKGPLTGSTTWREMSGTKTVRKVWNGRAQLEEIEADGPNGHFEDLMLVLYSPSARQFSLRFASGNSGVLSVPMFGAFKDGRGEFYDQEPLGDHTILVRVIWSDITPGTHHFEQAFSDDGGKTWETNFTASLSR
jgi:hypothetical protein